MGEVEDCCPVIDGRKEIIGKGRTSLEEVEELEDEDVMEISPAQFTPRKRRAVKVKEQLDDKFLRRSKRNGVKLDGYKSPRKEVPAPVPLAMIPATASAPAPHLTKEIVEGIATGFL
ncbi:unnamed protein product [Miscanthus lutarioriparius]|uniref:Uncharacterized protein n=1 Tax=Miscanthus lutarioriparius TaxID=422564 RepID=A0A811NGT0_9POAL|nr:unnamed protein product [Miscanthus lutarioriparius]